MANGMVELGYLISWLQCNSWSFWEIDLAHARLAKLLISYHRKRGETAYFYPFAMLFCLHKLDLYGPSNEVVIINISCLNTTQRVDSSVFWHSLYSVHTFVLLLFGQIGNNIVCNSCTKYRCGIREIVALRCGYKS